MRLQFCNLNFYLHQKGCVESAICNCGNGVETLDHYFFHCTRYIVQRQAMLDTIQQLNINTPICYALLICGSNELDSHANISLTDIVIQFLMDTNRF
jgi:hypothetical protein